MHRDSCVPSSLYTPTWKSPNIAEGSRWRKDCSRKKKKQKSATCLVQEVQQCENEGPSIQIIILVPSLIDARYFGLGPNDGVYWIYIIRVGRRKSLKLPLDAELSTPVLYPYLTSFAVCLLSLDVCSIIGARTHVPRPLHLRDLSSRECVCDDNVAVSEKWERDICYLFTKKTHYTG